MKQIVSLNEIEFDELLKSGKVYALVKGKLKGIVNIYSVRTRKTEREIQRALYEAVCFRASSTYALAKDCDTNLVSARRHLKLLEKDGKIERYEDIVWKTDKNGQKYPETYTYWKVKS
mgnify:CR=1 FL=1|jgi:hypothetical protein